MIQSEESILKYATRTNLHNRYTLKPKDDVYETNIKGIKVAKYEGYYFLWCKDWWYGFKKKSSFITFLMHNKVIVYPNEEEQ